MLSSFRIRVGNISPSETQWHLPFPLPLARRGRPSNTAMPRPTARTIPNRSSDGWGTVAHLRCKVPIGYNGTAQLRPQVPFPVNRSPNHTCLMPGPVRPMMPNGIRIRSAVFPQCTGHTDRPTDRATDRSFTGKFDDYRPLRYESDAA